MKKILKYVTFSFVFFLSILTITGCNSNSKLDEIAKKINNCETVKNYKQYDYDIKATVKKDTLTISTTVGEEKSTVDFQLDGDILSNENLSVNDLMATLLVINGIGQTYGYKDGELSLNLNTFTDEFKQYTLENEGLELIIGDDNVSFKIDLSKKVPLIDMNQFYLKEEHLDMISEFLSEGEHGNQSGKIGNIAYDIMLGEEESTIQIGQDEKLSNSAYQSILTALEVMYGEDVAKHFQEIYPEFKDGKTTVEAFTIDTNYSMKDLDDSIFKGTKIVTITIQNNEV